MHLILLGGNSIMNRDWIEEVEQSLSDLFDSTHIHYYCHWKEGKPTIDFDEEVSELTAYCKSLKKTYSIFAKSAGTILTLRTIHEKKITPERCIFTGTAVPFGKGLNQDVDLFIQDYNVPTLFIQKTNDTAFSFANLKAYLRENKVKNEELVEIPGGDHHYEDLRKIHDLIKEFMSIDEKVSPSN